MNAAILTCDMQIMELIFFFLNNNTLIHFHYVIFKSYEFNSLQYFSDQVHVITFLV